MYLTLLFCLCRYLISQGASKNALTDEGERPIDLVDPNDQVRTREAGRGHWTVSYTGNQSFYTNVSLFFGYLKV